ncbi:AAA family ATPase [Desulfobulbus sp.]|uniref:AAA family ATPase n=1 Tax=Desulfobulbus sp. TaxID=895 RepID=UPI00286F0DCE|nr:AAA family ATPase [Desulfobulbus sp.]
MIDGFNRDTVQALVAGRVAEEEADTALVASAVPERRPLQVDPEFFSSTAYLNYFPPSYEWLLGKSLRRGCLGVIAGPPGAGKGTLAIQFAVAVAGGLPFLDTWPVPSPGPVLYLSAEDDALVIHRRAHHALMQLPENIRSTAAASFYGVAVHGQVHLCTGGRGTAVTPTPHLADLRTLLEKVRPSLLILDTLARFAGIEENDNPAMTGFCGHLEDIIADLDCNIILLHHSNKTAGDCVESPDELAKALTQTAMRGASALSGCIRWGLLMAPLGASLAVKLIGDEARGRADGSFVAVRVGKKNAGAPEPRYYLARGEQGLLYRVEAAGQEKAEGDIIADAHNLAEEVRRREADGEKRMSVSRCGQDAFSWGISRTRKTVERGLALELFFKVKSGKREHLCSDCSDCSDDPGTKELLNEIQ